MTIEEAIEAIKRDDFAIGAYTGIMVLGTALSIRENLEGKATSFTIQYHYMQAVLTRLLGREATRIELSRVSRAIAPLAMELAEERGIISQLESSEEN